jgi:cellulose synthase operon protein C
MKSKPVEKFIKKTMMKKTLFNVLITSLLLTLLVACSTPEEKAEKYYQKGMALLDKEPAKAKLEFQNALQIKKNMLKAMYGLGLVAEREGDWKGSFALMREVAEQDPKNMNATIKLGQIFLAANQLDYALEKSKKALELDKNNVSALNLYAAVQLKMNNKSEALEYANLALAQDANNEDTFIVLANISLAESESTKAIEYFDKALAKNEKNLTVQFLKVKALETLEKPTEAEKSYQKMLQLFPDNTFVKKTYAQFLMKSGRSADAEQQLRVIAQSSSDNLTAKLDVINFILASKGDAAGRAEMESYVKKEPQNYDLAFALGDLYRAQKDPVAEEKLLNQIISQAKNTQPGYKAQSLIAYQLIANGKNAEASKILNEVIEADKSNSLALTLRASLALQAKNYDAAISDLRSVLRDSPDTSNAALMLATAYESSGSAELAEESFLKAFESSKLSSQYGIPYTQFLMRRKQPERAEKLLESLLSSHPNDAPAIRALAQFKIARGDYAGAQALADRVKDMNSQSALSDEILGAMSLNKKDLAASINAFKRAHEKAPNDLKPINAIVSTYVQAGKTPEAIAFVQTLTKMNPSNADVKMILGQLYASSGMTQNAVQTFNDVIHLSPNMIAAYQRLALALVNSQFKVEAEKAIEQGLKVAPNDFGLRITQASVYEASGKFDKAIAVYEKLMAERPDADIVANNLASLLLDNRKDKASYQRAYQLINKAKTNQYPQFLDTLGWAAYKMGKLDEAEAALTEATDKLPEVAVFHYHLAKVYIAKNDRISARQSLKNAIKFATNARFEQEFELKDDANQLLKSLQATN